MNSSVFPSSERRECSTSYCSLPMLSDPTSIFLVVEKTKKVSRDKQ